MLVPAAIAPNPAAQPPPPNPNCCWGEEPSLASLPSLSPRPGSWARGGGRPAGPASTRSACCTGCASWPGPSAASSSPRGPPWASGPGPCLRVPILREPCLCASGPGCERNNANKTAQLKKYDPALLPHSCGAHGVRPPLHTVGTIENGGGERPAANGVGREKGVSCAAQTQQARRTPSLSPTPNTLSLSPSPPCATAPSTAGPPHALRGARWRVHAPPQRHHGGRMGPHAWPSPNLQPQSCSLQPLLPWGSHNMPRAVPSPIRPRSPSSSPMVCCTRVATTRPGGSCPNPHVARHPS